MVGCTLAVALRVRLLRGVVEAVLRGVAVGINDQLVNGERNIRANALTVSHVHYNLKNGHF
jgi:hypothetical protein|tara:strand:+ start:2239 stop:2421 length:183 start_codon:yes stop_codon:yes gene_type:complete